MKILIAFEDAGARALLGRTLKDWGYEVVSVADGADALEVLNAEEAPRIMIASRDLPQMDCPTLCRTIRLRTGAPYVYTLLVARSPDDAKLAAAPDAEIDDYLLPPVDTSRLRHRLRVARRILDLQDEVARARELLRSQATKDAATGLWNRGAILGILEREIGRARRKGTPLACIRIDLDNYERVSEDVSPNIADAAVRHVARTVQHLMRPYDSMGRYGDEKFLLVLPDCDLFGARAVARKIGSEFEDPDFELQGEQVTLEVVVGVGATEGDDKRNSGQILRIVEASLADEREQRKEGSTGFGVTSKRRGKGAPPPPFDLDFLQQVAAGDEAIANEMLDQFLSSARERVEAIKQAMSQHDADTAADNALRMRGHFASFGTTSLVLLAGRLEAFIDERNWEDMSGVLDRLGKEIARLEEHARPQLSA